MLDRDPLKFGRLFTDEDTKSALVGTIRRPRTERDRQVLTTVLHALQRGELVAYNGADAVSRDFWTDKTPQYIRRSTHFLCRRENVLALWPYPLPEPDTATAAPTPVLSAQAIEPEPRLAEPHKRRRGAAPGKLDRYRESDRALFDELKLMMRDRMMSSTAAANILADQGRVAGIGTEKSRAKRLAERFRRDHRN
jgi:hypothetical protein